MKTLATETCTVREHKATAVLIETYHGYRHALVLKIETPLASNHVMFEVEYRTVEGDTCQYILAGSSLEPLDDSENILALVDMAS